MRFLAVLLIGLSSAMLAAASGYVIVLDETPGAHALLRRLLTERQIPIRYEAHTLLNALFIEAPESQLDELRALPGVRAVTRERRFQLQLDTAEKLINVPAAWIAVGGLSKAGAGIRIAVIDTGLETTHPEFQDASLTAPAGFPVCSIVNQPQIPLDCSQYTNGKIIAARSFVPLLSGTAAADSRPDDNTPRDRVGHGTAVATAAAGAGVNGIGGVAPKAWLGSYKVFGSPGVVEYTSDSAIIAALEAAFNDHMDVAVLSLGAPALSGALDKNCGSGTQYCDLESIAVENAVAGGMVVVVAAGNLGDSGTTVQPTLSTATTPGIAPSAISVAAVTNAHTFANGLNIEGLGNFRARLGGTTIAGDSLTAPLTDAANAGDGLACSPLAPGSLTGTIALVQRGVCTFVNKAINLQNAGAIAAIVTNSPGDNTILSVSGAAIPVAFTGYDDGQTIRNWLQTASSPRATLLTALQAFPVLGGEVAPFSSRGPALGTGAIKPDIAAVGTELYLSGQTYDPNGDLYTASGFLVSQGTSFAAPQVAGVAALVKQAHPTLSALAVKSAILNTATQDVTENGAPASVLAVGAGKADAAAAVNANLTAQPASLSFGILPAGTVAQSQQIQLTNLSSTPLTLGVTIARRTAENTAHISIDRPNITLAANQQTALTISLTGTQPAPGNYEGFIAVQGSASALRIPFLYTVGDGVPRNILPLLGDGDDGNVNQPTSFGSIVLQLLDRYGVPVANAPVRFNVGAGGGVIRFADSSTDRYGLAGASVLLGSDPGQNTWFATAGGLSTSFNATARPQPFIQANGVVDAAGFRAGVPVSPGSYAAIFGSNLAPSTQVKTTPYLPVSLAQVSVGFNTPTISAPGHLHFVTPSQVNVQIPWELAGQPSAQMKVALQDSSGNVYTLPLATWSPGIFEIPGSAGAIYAAARDENFAVISPANPARQGRIIQLYCNGLGPVDRPPASGDPAPLDTLVHTLTTPDVSIGGMPAPIQFSGLTPGVVGLYQLNVTVPNTGPGIQPVIVRIGGLSSKPENLAVQ